MPRLIRQSPDRDMIFFQYENQSQDTAQTANKDVKEWSVEACLTGQHVKQQARERPERDCDDDDGHPCDDQMACSLELHITLS